MQKYKAIPNYAGKEYHHDHLHDCAKQAKIMSRSAIRPRANDLRAMLSLHDYGIYNKALGVDDPFLKFISSLWAGVKETSEMEAQARQLPILGRKADIISRIIHMEANKQGREERPSDRVPRASRPPRRPSMSAASRTSESSYGSSTSIPQPSFRSSSAPRSYRQSYSSHDSTYYQRPRSVPVVNKDTPQNSHMPRRSHRTREGSPTPLDMADMEGSLPDLNEAPNTGPIPYPNISGQAGGVKNGHTSNPSNGMRGQFGVLNSQGQFVPVQDTNMGTGSHPMPMGNGYTGNSNPHMGNSYPGSNPHTGNGYTGPGMASSSNNTFNTGSPPQDMPQGATQNTDDIENLVSPYRTNQINALKARLKNLQIKKRHTDAELAKAQKDSHQIETDIAAHERNIALTEQGMFDAQFAEKAQKIAALQEEMYAIPK